MERGLFGRLQHLKETFEAGGLDFPGVGSLLYVWRTFGPTKLLLIILLVGFPLGEYGVLRYAVYSAIPRTAGDLGFEFEAEEWSLSPLRLRATAREVTIRGRDQDDPVFTASSVVFQGRLSTFLWGLPDMLTFHLFGGQQPFNDISIADGELRLERSLTGQLNLSDFMASVPQDRIDEALDGVYQVRRIAFDDFRISYTEHTPGGSGDGIIRTAQSHVKIDELNGNIVDLVRPAQLGERPTRFTLSGRSADGTFAISGTAGLLAPEKGGETAADGNAGGNNIQQVALGGAGRRVSRPFDMTIALDNIAAAAYGRMVPVTTIVPINGSIDGKTRIVRVTDQPTCEGAFNMRNVKFGPNPLLLTDPNDVAVVRTAVTSLDYTGPFKLCDDATADPSIRQASAATGSAGEPPASGMLQRLNTQATAQASPGVKALVRRDQQALRGEPVDASVDAITTTLAREMGLRVGGALGGDIGEAVARSPRSGNAVTSGVRSVGSGIRRLFGGGRKD